jgi:large subunit ribosomal protein L5
MRRPRLQQRYQDEIRPALQKELGIDNVMAVPSVIKVVLNVGVKDAVSNSKALQDALDALTIIAGQKPMRRLARKSIAGFKLREGMPIGAMVTLRGRRMYEFLDNLINLALPKVRDFQGVSRRCDRQGNYNLGIKEWTIFPEIVDFDMNKKIYGMNISVHTTAQHDAHAVALLEKFGMPFKSA